ncbi:hypothetical protein KJA17_00305 [Patescibacteria group bacterium]|nr:hypothetical protein [Patescibacteria group bacterium]
MLKSVKNQIIILVALVLIIGGIISWAVFQKSKISPKEETIPEEEIVSKEIVAEEIFSLSGIVSKVDAENNLLTVKPAGEKNEVKVIVSQETKLFKLVYPSEPGNPSFALNRVKITIEDIKPEDRVFIKTNIDIAGKKEFNDVDYIEILP